MMANMVVGGGIHRRRRPNVPLEARFFMKGMLFSSWVAMAGGSGRATARGVRFGRRGSGEGGVRAGEGSIVAVRSERVVREKGRRASVAVDNSLSSWS